MSPTDADSWYCSACRNGGTIAYASDIGGDEHRQLFSDAHEEADHGCAAEHGLSFVRLHPAVPSTTP